MAFCGFPKIRGTVFGDPYNKDYNILGSMLGFPYFGKVPFSGLRKCVKRVIQGYIGCYRVFLPAYTETWGCVVVFRV